MKKILILLTCISLLLLQGCATVTSAFGSGKSKSDYMYYYVSHPAGSNGEITNKNGEHTKSDAYGQRYTFNGEKSQILSEVVAKMADQLLLNFPTLYRHESIALTSIVDLNDHGVTNWLGQTVSELLIHELHVRRFQVLDFKLTGNIQVTKSGEFALTRDWKKLNKSLDVQRILTGTMSRNEEGMIFNVRIVNAQTNIVESTSSAFVPHQMFVGGEYDSNGKKYFERDSQLALQNKAQVRLVR